MKNSSLNTHDATKELLEAIANDKGIEYILEIGHKMLENPICLQDTSRKLIALTNSPSVEDDSVWIDLMTIGYSSQKTMQYSYAAGLENVISNAVKPVIWGDSSYLKYRRIFTRIMYKKTPIGLLVIMEGDRPFKDGDLELAAILSDAISAEMQKNTFFHNNLGQGYEMFLKEIVEGNNLNKNEIYMRANSMQLNLKKCIFLVVINIQELDKTLILSTYMRKTLEYMFIDSKTIIYNDNVILLFSCDNAESFLDTGMQELESYLKDYHLQCGVSNVFDDIANMQAYYYQAQEALKIGKMLHPGDIIYKYEDHTVYHLLDVCSKSMPIRFMIHPSLYDLLDYDRNNGTNYFSYLEMYFKCGRNIPLTAERFGIHRNSMIYRMKKLREIMNTDLSDHMTLLNIELSLRLLEFTSLNIDS